VIILNYEGKVIKLFEMVWSRRWKKWLLCPLAYASGNRKDLVIQSDFSTYLIYLF